MEMELIIPKDIFSLTKKEIKANAIAIAKHELTEGLSDPIKVYVSAKKMVELFTTLVDEFKGPALNEAEKYGEKVISKYNSKIELCSVYTTYDFSNCGDSYYDDLITDLNDINEKIKDRQEFLKNLPGRTVVRDEDTGEEIILFPAVKKSTDGIKITY